MTTFVRLLDVDLDTKATVLGAAIRRASAQEKQDELGGDIRALIFDATPADFAEVPGSPFAYWLSASVRCVFGRLPPFESNARTASIGASTKNDFRYVRAFWEVRDGNVAAVRASTANQTWCLFAKGGSFSPFYSDPHLLVAWRDDGREIKADITEYRGARGWGYQWSAALNGHDSYFRPGLTWPRRTTSGLNVRVMPTGCIFADKGPAAFIEGDDPSHLLALLALLSSKPLSYLVNVQLAAADAAARSYEVGVIQRTPVPELPNADKEVLATVARRAWSIKRTLDCNNETSHAFVLPLTPFGYKPTAPNLPPIARARAQLEAELADIQRAIDDRTFELYGIGREDRSVIESAMSSRSDALVQDDDGTDVDDAEDEAIDHTPSAAGELAVYSWLVGVAFGRFDKRLATGERAVPPEPEPFAPLPTRSPGMWPEGEARDVAPPPILVDDVGHKDDIIVHMTNAGAGTGYIGASLPDDIRQWLARNFFPLHIQMYSKSRRKAPIYWQLATTSASYSVWLYIHAFTKDTFYKVQNDYAGPKLEHEERKLENLRREAGSTPKPAERKALAAQEALVDELRAFLAEVKRIAPLWNPNLDDGVIINFAPLWRLVPHHKPWQKEVKATWDALCAGEYDWAHLAMHLWPERVVPKCATDRSLAIAHGLEDVFWVEGTDGKWKPREKPLQPVEEIVREHTSTAVKAALASLLEAPSAQGAPKPARRRGAR